MKQQMLELQVADLEAQNRDLQQQVATLEGQCLDMKARLHAAEKAVIDMVELHSRPRDAVTIYELLSHSGYERLVEHFPSLKGSGSAHLPNDTAVEVFWSAIRRLSEATTQLSNMEEAHSALRELYAQHLDAHQELQRQYGTFVEELDDIKYAISGDQEKYNQLLDDHARSIHALAEYAMRAVEGGTA